MFIFFIYLRRQKSIYKEISRQKETLQIDIFAGLKRKDWLYSACQPGSEAVDCSSTSSLYLKAMGYMQRSVPCAALTHTHTYSNNLIFVLLPRWLFWWYWMVVCRVLIKIFNGEGYWITLRLDRHRPSCTMFRAVGCIGILNFLIGLTFETIFGDL